jgi:hypothetical protein
MRLIRAKKWYWLALLCAYLQLSACGGGGRDNPFFDEQEPAVSGTIEEPAPWMEREFQLPPFPKDGDLLRVEPMRPDPQFEYWIDREHLSIAEDDVVRYTLVISARQGNARNVRVEGIRCATTEYRTYAYGTEQDTLKPARRSIWRPIPDDLSDRIRGDLKRYYFCKEGRGVPFRRSQILHYLRVGGDSGGQRFLFE